MSELCLCPHLGIPGDKEVRYRYPTAVNVCYVDLSGWSRFRPVEPAHQRQFCLTIDHVLCPIYLRAMANAQHDGRQVRAQTHLEFFGLREEPFSIVPQPHFLCESQSQRQAHVGLRWLIDHRQGLGLLLGDVGTGKTLLCHALFEELSSDPQFATVLLLTPSQRSEYALMADLLGHWKVKPQRGYSLRNLEAAAHQFLVGTVLDRGQTAVLIVDEAQTLSSRLLQQVCRLLNWQDGGQQLLQVILAGQPSLQGKLARVPALRDRAVVEFMLTTMTQVDMRQMISERLQRAGRRGDLFAPSALQLIYHKAGGMPRRVTILCLRCLWSAYLQGDRYITKEVVQAVIEHASDGDLFVLPGRAAAVTAAGQSTLAHQPLPTRLFGRLQQLWARLVA